MLNGIDVSKWQGRMDWAKARGAGAQFAVVRAGSIDNMSGVCYMDYEYPYNKGEASGLPISYYWFFRPNHPAKRQAEYFLNLVHGEKRDFALWCDIEVEGQASVVREFCEAVRKVADIGIYTNPNTVLYKLTGDKSWMASYPLWLADWTPPANVPKPWSDWVMWQYAVKQNGKEYGAMSAAIDHNYGREEFIQAPPVVGLEERLRECEGRVETLYVKAGQLELEAWKLAERVKKLEDVGTLPRSETRFVIGPDRANARCFEYKNAADRPIFQIYPNDNAPVNERVQWDAGTILDVEPDLVTGDGGLRCFRVNGSELYVRFQDGVLRQVPV